MKKITLFAAVFFAFGIKAAAQCTEPLTVPYQMDTESVTAPNLPPCVETWYESFASNEVFETLPGPIAGFNGNVLAYDTTINTEFGMPADAWNSAQLASPLLQLTQGVMYTVSYKYANSDSQRTIDNLAVSMIANNFSGVTVATHENITGAAVHTFVSEPFTVSASGQYRIMFNVSSEGTQGQLYLDDISIQAVVMSTAGNTLSSVAVYPNPVKDAVFIANGNQVDRAELYNITGQLVLSQSAALDQPISTQNLARGVYVMKLSSGGATKNIKIIKE